MTSLDATFAYADPQLSTRARGLGDGAQRVLMALMVIVLLEMLLLPNPLLTQFTGYAEAGGGNPLLKIHFYSYTLFLALAYVAASMGLVRFTAEQVVVRPGVVQFAVVIMACTMITILRHGIGGVAYMVDTLLAAPLAVMLAFSLDEERRRKLTSFIVYFVTFNAAIGVVERLARVHFIFTDLDKFEYFRATALLGHPLENAFVTSSAMFLALAMPWSAWKKALILSICMAGILAFGARSSFVMTIVLSLVAAIYVGARSLLRGDMRLSTLVAAPWIATLALAAGAVLTLGTVLGERIVKLAKFDESAQVRVDSFKIFNYLNWDKILNGIDFAERNFLIDTYKDVNIIENCWIAIILMIGGILFVVFALSLLGFLRSIGRGRGAIAAFAILNFLLVASTSNSISTKTPSLAIFAVALVGIPFVTRRRRVVEEGEPLRYTAPLRDGVWS
jgi:hypothetical protein